MTHKGHDRCPWQQFAEGVKKIKHGKAPLLPKTVERPVEPYVPRPRAQHPADPFHRFPSSEDERMFEAWFRCESNTPPPPSPCFKSYFTEKRLRKIRTGTALPEAKADFHGYDLAKMERALTRSLAIWRLDGVRLASVITGKGSGKLRAALPALLASPENAAHVLAFEPSGEGSFLVYLRKR